MLERLGRTMSIQFILLYVVWVMWLFAYPFQLNSDDALNFHRAIERFSVLEFRPHFPGYPTFVGASWLASILNPEVAAANVVVSFVSVMLIPILVFVIVKQLSRSIFSAALAGMLVMTQSLMGALALNGLSDSLALVCLLFALLMVLGKRYILTGVWIGLMLSTRPSYFPLVLVFLMVPMITEAKGLRVSAYLKAGISVALIGALSLLFIWVKDGAAYIEEGIRFTTGHFTIWGNTVSTQDASVIQWIDVLVSEYTAMSLILILCSLLYGLSSFYRFSGMNTSDKLDGRDQCWQGIIASIGLVYLVWMLLAQNPENLRHWAPVVLLFCIVLSLQLNELLDTKRNTALVASVFVLCGFAIIGWQSINLRPDVAPVQQAIRWINNQSNNKFIGSNYCVNLLKDRLTDSVVFDMYYPSSAIALNKKSDRAWRLSNTELKNNELITQFPARFSGERRLYLYKMSQ